MSDYYSGETDGPHSGTGRGTFKEDKPEKRLRGWWKDLEPRDLRPAVKENQEGDVHRIRSPVVKVDESSRESGTFWVRVLKESGDLGRGRHETPETGSCRNKV